MWQMGHRFRQRKCSREDGLERQQGGGSNKAVGEKKDLYKKTAGEKSGEAWHECKKAKKARKCVVKEAT